MNRFKILRGKTDPFVDKPNGDDCKYKLLNNYFPGWKINDTEVMIDLPKSTLAYLSALKQVDIEINHPITKRKTEFFRVDTVFNQNPYTNMKTGMKRVRVHFLGKIYKTSNIGMP